MMVIQNMLLLLKWNFDKKANFAWKIFLTSNIRSLQKTLKLRKAKESKGLNINHLEKKKPSLLTTTTNIMLISPYAEDILA